jgi:hypothetical protein
VALKASNADVLREMQGITRLAAEPVPPGDNVKGAIGRAARALHLTYRRAYSLWYGAEKTLVREEEAARLRVERTRLLELRLERLGREIAETERLIAEALRREEARAEAVGRAQSAGRMDISPLWGPA